MSNRRLLISIGVVLVLGLFFLTIVHRHKESRDFEEVTVNLQNPWLHDENIYFYTGSFFARYDTGSDSIERLSDYLNIQNGINAPSWGTDAVIFQTDPSSGNRDDVTVAADELGAKPYQPHWWKYSFKTKQYQLIALPGADSCGLLTQISSKLLACLTSQQNISGANTLKILDLSSGSSKTLFNTDDDIGDITSDGQNIYFLLSKLSGGQSLNAISLSSSSRKELYSSNGQITYYAYGNGRVLLDDIAGNSSVKKEDSHESSNQPAASKQKLVLLDGDRTVLVKKLKSLPLSFFSDKAGDILFSSLDGSVKSIDGEKIRTLYKPAVPVLANGDFLFTASSKLYKLSSGGELTSSPATSRSNDSKSPESFNTAKDNDPSGNSFIDDASGGQQDVYIYLSNVSSSQQQAAVGDFLEKKGFKPSEFNFSWVVDGADFHVPVNPNATVIK